MNEHGLDVKHFKTKLYLILRDINFLTPAEMRQKLLKLSDSAIQSKAQSQNEKKSLTEKEKEIKK